MFQSIAKFSQTIAKYSTLMKVEVETEREQISDDSRASVTSHELLVSDCKEMFLSMFCKLVEVRILETPVSCWDKLVISDRCPEADSQGLERLLHQVLSSNEVTPSGGDQCQHSVNVESKSESEQFTEAFSLACNCILELSSMPKYNNQSEARILTIDQSEAKSSSEAGSSLPSWLSGLLLCTTLRTKAASISPIQLAAVSTVVELCTLVRH